MTMNKTPFIKMLSIMEERANERWPAMYNLMQYRTVKEILNKEAHTITYAEKEVVRESMRAMCLALGLDYYRLLQKVCQK